MPARRLLLAALAASLASAAPASAAAPSREDAVRGAEAAARAHSGAVRLGPDQALAARDVVVDPDGATHVRFARRFRGLDVLGGDVVVHRGPDGAFRAPSLTLGRLPVRQDAVLGAGDAAARVSGPNARLDGRPRLVVEARRGAPRLAWLVRTTGTQADGTPSERDTTVDAVNGDVLVGEERNENVTGSGRALYSGTVPLETTLASGSYQMKDATRASTYTVDMQGKTSSRGTLLTDGDNVWGSGTTADRATVGVDAQYGSNETWDYYKTAHGRLGIDGNGGGSYNRVHYGRSYANAFWSDSCGCMTYGDGDGRSFGPLVSLDVAGHEMSHGVTSHTANLTYSGESGGLNEANSDIFGTLVEFYAANPSDTPDYTIGEKISLTGKPLRWMDDPKKDGSSASCYTPTVGTLDVHASSGVGNHFFYLLAVGSGQSAYGNSPTCDGSTVTGIGNDAAGRIWYRALTVYMTSATNYSGARAATIRAAQDLYGVGSVQAGAVDAAWRGVAVTA